MAREQTGVCAEPNLHGLLLLFNALDGHAQALRRLFADLPYEMGRLADQFSEANLNTTLAIGAAYWDSLYPKQRPAGLASFHSLEVGDLAMPASPADFLLYLRADRYDVVHLACQHVVTSFMQHADLIEQTHLFRFMDGRSLTGFVLEPPYISGRKKRELALIPTEAQPDFAQGSYVHLQRYRLDVARWQMLTQAQQEQIIGKTKLDASPLADEQLTGDSHAQRCQLFGAEAARFDLVFQDMPFAQMRAQGHVSIGFSRDATAFVRWLEQRMGDGVQHYDLLLDYIQADSGAAFFAPSINFLEDAATAAD